MSKRYRTVFRFSETLKEGNKNEKNDLSNFAFSRGTDAFSRLFTLEGNFIATDAIQDMLMFSEWGRLRLFPAIPSGWRDASFESFRGFGGILVDAEMKDGVIVSVTVRATSPVEVTVENDLSHLTATVPIRDGVLTLAEGETAEFTL